ncbi:MAG TPA: hypothetical protein VK838_04780 [Candidatus Limnocylindrales bacterium]|nr:hypothetical protein [Candidatus Limnocylindrales bacterium]
MSTFLRRSDLAVWVGLSGILVGASVLLVYAWVEYLNHPGISLADGYWIGRVPWTPAGVLLVLAGSTLALLAGTASVLARGDWVRWLLLLPVAAAPVLWWLLALGVLPFPRYQPVDPVTFAYSLPETAALLLILPSVAVAALAFIPIRPDRRVRLRPVHRDGERRPPSITES